MLPTGFGSPVSVALEVLAGREHELWRIAALYEPRAALGQLLGGKWQYPDRERRGEHNSVAGLPNNTSVPSDGNLGPAGRFKHHQVTTLGAGELLLGGDDLLLTDGDWLLGQIRNLDRPDDEERHHYHRY